MGFSMVDFLYSSIGKAIEWFALLLFGVEQWHFEMISAWLAVVIIQ